MLYIKNLEEEHMKKILAILMAIAMVFSFAACGTKKDGGNDTEKKLKV